MRRIFPSSLYNLTSMAGASVAAISFGLILFLFLLEFFAKEQKPYLGIIAFVFLPMFLILGLLLVLIGFFRTYRRKRAGTHVQPKLPHINLNHPQHLATFVVFSIIIVLLLMFSAFGSFQAYEYTASNSFCGEVCHTVMHPEYMAFQHSPHAKINCVNCHIGSGTEWFIRSKLSGAYRLYALLTDAYVSPIPTPIPNQRLSEETCEACHWRNNFAEQRQHVFDYFLSNEENTHKRLHLLVKIGGGEQSHGPASGIHWHMNIEHKVTFAYLDEERLKIPWIESKGADGKVKIYKSSEISITDEELQQAKKRRMNCSDCHNRPAHQFHPPEKAINIEMAKGNIDTALPSIKKITVASLNAPYPSQEAAFTGIESFIHAAYEKEYPQAFTNMKPKIAQAISVTQRIYEQNFFPGMKVSWQAYPNNIGHMYTQGCFRCHDGMHVTQDGDVLKKACNGSCHTILAQGNHQGIQAFSLIGVDFEHPEDIGNTWEDMLCSDCHSGQEGK